MKTIIQTELAPKAIGPYSQAVKAGNTVYFSGQIPLDPKTMVLVSDEIKEQAFQVFTNLNEVSKAAGGSLEKIVKLTIYLVDLSHFSVVNEAMMQFCKEPFPARTTIEVSGLPKGALVEVEAVMVV